MSIQPKLHTSAQKYKRTDIWLADLGNNMDSEISGKRPVVILQNDIGNRYSPTIIITPVSTSKKQMPTHVPLGAELNGLDRDSYVLTEHILTISKRRLKKRLSRVHPNIMDQVEEKLLLSCGIQIKHPSSYQRG